MEYEIITNNSTYELKRQVNKMIGLGWEPLGGISVTGEGIAYQYVQAMVKRDAK